jgi:hypothetical protein
MTASSRNIRAYAGNSRIERWRQAEHNDCERGHSCAGNSFRGPLRIENRPEIAKYSCVTQSPTARMLLKISY